MDNKDYPSELKQSQQTKYLFGDKSVSNITFYLFLIYLSSYLLHFTARISALGTIRFDLMLFLIIVIMLVVESNKLSGRFNNSCCQILFILLGYIIISLPFVEWPGSILRENISDFIKVIVFFYFTILIIDTDVRLRQLVFIFVACEILRIIEPLYLHEMYGYWGDETYLGEGVFADRLSGAPSDVVNPNGLGFVIATAFPFIHYLSWYKGWLSRLLYLSMLPILLYTLLLTLSRSGFVALSVVVWYIFYKSKHKLFIIITVIAVAVFLWGSMDSVQKDRYYSLTGSTDTMGSAGVYARLHGFGKSLDTIIKNPIVGYGLGTSKEASYYITGSAHITHVLYMEVWIELGTIGFIIYMIFIMYIFNTLRDTTKKIEYIKKESEKDSGGYKLAKCELDYDQNLIYALVSCFYMFLIFSLAQYGVSEHHWYFIAGLAVVFNNKITSQANRIYKNCNVKTITNLV